VKVYQDFEEVGKIPNAVLTIGTFDGVHLGHQKIIERLKEEARKVNGETVLFTFFPHPRMVINPSNHGLKLIQTQAEKIENLERLGLDHLIIFPFTKEFSNLSADEFVKDYLVDKLHVKTIVVGYDHQFGKNREGSLKQLQKLSETLPFEVIEIPAHEVDEINVSSTKIRQAIEIGDVQTANSYLNEPFEISGKVVKGNQIGRTIGFPTANIEIGDDLKIVPTIGVYAVEVILEDQRKLQGMMNIGIRPTVTDSKEVKIEVFIFDFSEAIYDQSIKVYLLQRIRGEHRFQSVEVLRAQLQEDEKTVRSIFSHQPSTIHAQGK
jgi:riboflavin kinase / FMN adenylyltransferase